MIQTIDPEPSLHTRFDIATFLDDVRPAIERHRGEADAQRSMPGELADELRRAGAFGLSTPVELDGLELSLTTALAVYEALGRIDGPAAWNIWNGNLGFTAAMLGHEATRQIWDGTRAPIIANSARTAGAGLPVAGGFRLSGRWDIVSAIDIADWVALFGLVMVDGAPRLLGGAPDVRVFFVPTADVQVLDTWHTSGMRGTGSKTVVVDDVMVPEMFAISPFAAAHVDRPLFRIPAFTLASSGAAPIVVGIARAALDELIALAPTKATDNGQMLAERGHVQSQIARAQMSLDAASLLLLDSATHIDRAAIAGEPVTEVLRARLRAAMSHAAAVSREVLSTCQLLASSSAIYTANAIERLVRDGMTASQHMLLSPTHLDILGRLTFGLDPGTPVI